MDFDIQPTSSNARNYCFLRNPRGSWINVCTTTAWLNIFIAEEVR